MNTIWVGLHRKFPILSKRCFPAAKYYKHLCKHSKTKKNTKWRTWEIIILQDSITLHTTLDIERISKKWLDFKNSRIKKTFSEKMILHVEERWVHYIYVIWNVPGQCFSMFGYLSERCGVFSFMLRCWWLVFKDSTRNVRVLYSQLF